MPWKVEAQGDVLYFAETTLAEAKSHFTNSMGDVPENLLTWTEIDELPEDFEELA